MTFQNSLEALLGMFIAFYIGCISIGRPDIPFRVVADLLAKALQGTTACWGCPSAFNKGACKEYDPKRYK
jgi:hypothetical protein